MADGRKAKKEHYKEDYQPYLISLDLPVDHISRQVLIQTNKTVQKYVYIIN